MHIYGHYCRIVGHNVFGILECWTFELIQFGHISNIGYLKRECSSRQTLMKFLGISSIMSFGVGYGVYKAQ